MAKAVPKSAERYFRLWVRLRNHNMVSWRKPWAERSRLENEVWNAYQGALEQEVMPLRWARTVQFSKRMMPFRNMRLYAEDSRFQSMREGQNG